MTIEKNQVKPFQRLDLSLSKKYIAFMHIDEKEFYDLMLKEEPPFISRRC